MYRQLAPFSYWAGLACVAIDVVWRALAVLWVNAPGTIYGLSRTTFRNAAMVFLLLSVASVAYAWLQLQATQGTQKSSAGAS